ncbi:2216_t:CDS:2 [Cetraspora pellucida]|uniref:2216_t:CDS:1 n=1 Tax=Cetraspora pellucida TaxID=1433469 RepID=A0ACA9LCK0_9GLOM|nr:2216_t:CDS:2 [Cetraspora pellucida]
MTTSISNNIDEVTNAKVLYKDINDYLDFLADILQTETDESDEPISPTVEKFLKEYQEYVSSNAPPLSSSPTSYSTDSTSSNSSKRNSRRSSIYKPNLWRYSLGCENECSRAPPKSVKRLSLPTTASISEIDFDKQGFAMFSPLLKSQSNDKIDENDEGNTLNNNNLVLDSPSIKLLKQLDNTKSDQTIAKVDKSPVTNLLTKIFGDNFFGDKKTDANQAKSEKSNEVSVPDNNSNNREAGTQTREPVSLVEIFLSLAKIGNISRADYLPSCVRWDQWDRWEFY